MSHEPRQGRGAPAAGDELLRAEAEILALKASLDERTAQLTKAAETLRREAEERQRAEEVLRRGEERYRSLVEAVTAIVWNTPASGEFETEQPGWSAFTGQDFDRLKGWGWLNAVHPDDRPHTARVWSAAVASRSLYEVEHRLRRHDGVYRHMMVRAVPILDESGAIREWVGIHTDIDDLKQAEAAQRHAREAAEAANRAKSEFLANMSHEIRTPMNGIIGMTDLALDTELTTDQREYLEMVKSSADYLMAVINDILDFSKIEAAKLDLDPIDFNLRDHLDDTVTTLALRAHTQGLELACHVFDNVPDALIGDPGRLRQVLVNLIGNAVKFTSVGEVVLSVAVEAGNDKCGMMNEESRTESGMQPSSFCILHFRVRDTGIGIPSEKLGLLFQAFSQVDSSTTRKYGGTGLGLAISSQLVRLMGGRMWVESEQGRGSTFHFTARFGLSNSPAPRQATVGLARARELAVLVVDDNATNRRILHEILTLWGLMPTAAGSGREALALMHRAAEAGEPFPLVLLDNMMPEMDGFMLAEEIRNHPGLAGSTLMMLSSADRRDNAVRCRELGVTAYLTKPIRRAELLSAILAVVGDPGGEKVRAGSGVRSAIGRGERPLRLLLTEDNLVNQKLAIRLLEKRGHSVVVAGTGREALEALAGESFDVVLMDVQMPEMDGFEATSVIREREKATGGHVPIIAMTAHAMKGDRERCLQVGMDGYISKPLHANELFEAVESLAGSVRPSGEAVESVTPEFDQETALRGVRGDRELLNEIIDIYFAESPRWMAAIGAAVAGGDAGSLRREAHTLRGAVGVFGAQEASALAQRLEDMGRQGRLEGAAEACAALTETLARLGSELAAFRGGA
jgi:PAS domain S-box-containing protein